MTSIPCIYSGIPFFFGSIPGLAQTPTVVVTSDALGSLGYGTYCGTQGSASRIRLPVTVDMLRIIFGHRNLAIPDHLMFWAVCCLAYFGFLRASGFTVPNLQSYSPRLHPNVQDISIDSLDSLSCLRINIKASKTDPFRKGCHIFIAEASPLSVQWKSCYVIWRSEETPQALYRDSSRCCSKWLARSPS